VSTWEDAERAAPGCSVQWDVQDGPSHLDDSTPVIVALDGDVAIGWGREEPYSWALWIPAKDGRDPHWLFVEANPLVKIDSGPPIPKYIYEGPHGTPRAKRDVSANSRLTHNPFARLRR